MKFMRKKGKKIVLIITEVTFGLAVLLLLGLFLWMKTWKTSYSEDKKISIKYPPTGYLEPIKDVSIRDNFNHFFLVIHKLDRTAFLLPREIEPSGKKGLLEYAQKIAQLIKVDSSGSTIRYLTISGHDLYIITSPSILFDNYWVVTSNNGIVYDLGGRYLDSTGTKLNNSRVRTIINDIIIELMFSTIHFH